MRPGERKGQPAQRPGCLNFWRFRPRMRCVDSQGSCLLDRVMPPYQCPCGHSLPVEEGRGSHKVVCPRCGRESLLAGPEDPTLVRDAPAPTESLSLSTAMPTSSSLCDENAAESHGIGPYRRLEALRPWRYGTIYKAYHPALDRHVILRVLASEHVADPAVRASFLRSAQALSKLSHRNHPGSGRVWGPNRVVSGLLLRLLLGHCPFRPSVRETCLGPSCHAARRATGRSSSRHAAFFADLSCSARRLARRNQLRSSLARISAVRSPVVESVSGPFFSVSLCGLARQVTRCRSEPDTRQCFL